MNPQKKVAFYTLGCKLNFSETSAIARSFSAHGFAKVDFHDTADVYVINTCSVTDNADKKCRKVVRDALRTSPGAYIIVVGCYAQLKPEEIAEIPGVDLVLGASEKFDAFARLGSLEKQDRAFVYAGEIKHVNSFIPSYSAGDRTRSFLKVQDGCDYFCSFCTIPLARGRSRSDTIARTLVTARKAIATGVKELVLTGVNIGDFGKETGESFFSLIREMDALEGAERLRISSIEPNLLNDEIISFVASSKHFMPHLHIPLQSGSDKILKLMRRKYTRALYADRVQKIKTLIPHCAIGVDVIVGFPGETEEDFLNTYHFLAELDVSYLHIFTYSERANTTAVKMDHIVPQKERERRSTMLHILSEKKKRLFYAQHTGQPAKVLFESENHDGTMHGFTENYIKVTAPFDALLTNNITPVILSGINAQGEMVTKTMNEPTAV